MKKLSISLISNVTLEPYFSQVIKHSFTDKEIVISNILFSEFQSQFNLQTLSQSNIVIILLNFENIYPNCINDLSSKNANIENIYLDAFSNCKILYETLKKEVAAPIIWFGFEDYCYKNDIYEGTVSPLKSLVDKINLSLEELINEENTYIDLKRLIANIGLCKAYDNKNKYRWNSPYSKELINQIVKEINKQYLISTGSTKKCIVLDCDNVLWGGVLSEEGIDRVRISNSGLGRPFQDFQRFLLSLYYHGVILAICSKNDESDVLTMFREHNEMVLKEKHISCFCVNWNNKAENIKMIAETLNINFDSMVFVDDSEFEVNTVKSLLPDVLSIQFDCKNIYEQFSCFNLKHSVGLDSVLKRNETYKTNMLRKGLEISSESYEQYLKSLETKVDIHEAREIELSRISELTQRTNKCTNGKRYTVDELKKLFNKDSYKLYSVSVSDRFSDLGIVGAIGIFDNKLDLFSLSCRALGRNVEHTMMEKLKDFRIDSYDIISTGKNAEICDKLMFEFGKDDV